MNSLDEKYTSFKLKIESAWNDKHEIWLMDGGRKLETLCVGLTLKDAKWIMPFLEKTFAAGVKTCRSVLDTTTILISQEKNK